MAEPDNRRKKFYFDYSINPAYVGVLATAILTVLAWANGMDRKQATVEATLVAHSNEDKTLEKRVDKLETQTDDRLARMEAKLDRLIERSKK